MNDVNTLGDLIQKSREELLSYRNFGRKCVYIVEETLEHLGLSLRDENAMKYVDRLALTPQQWEQRFYEVAKEIYPKVLFTDKSIMYIEEARNKEMDKAISLALLFIKKLKEKSELIIEEGGFN